VYIAQVGAEEEPAVDAEIIEGCRVRAFDHPREARHRQQLAAPKSAASRESFTGSKAIAACRAF